jgi:transposase
LVQFKKFGQHQPLNRQAERYAKESVPISLSTLADQVGGCTAALMPLFKRLEAYVLSAERLHGDDTTVPVLAKGKTDIGRIWVYVRDDKPFGGPAPPGRCSITRATGPASIPRLTWPTTPGSSRLTPMTAMASFARAAAPGPILEAACWVHYPESVFMAGLGAPQPGASTGAVVSFANNRRCSFSFRQQAPVQWTQMPVGQLARRTRRLSSIMTVN